MPSTTTGAPSTSTPVTRAQSARPVGNCSPGTERQPSSSSSGSGIVSGRSEVSSTGLTTTPRARVPQLLVRAVEDEQPQVDADLVRRQPDAVGGSHRVEHVRDERAQRVVDLLDAAGGAVQHGIADDADGTHGHGGP